MVQAIADEEGAKAATKDLLSVSGMTEELARQLIEKGIDSQEALADLATDELVELVGLDEDLAKALIVAARAPWFVEE